MTAPIDGNRARAGDTVPSAAATPGAGTPPADPAAALIGRSLGGVAILSLLGKGSMGSVYKARQVELDRIVALKTIHAGLIADERIFARFRLEARTVGRFSTPHVVQIHEIGEEDGIHYLIMEYAAGGNLRELTRRQPDGRLAPRVALRLLVEAARGLLEAEKLGVIHRDVKAENLLLDAKGLLKVADFGIAKVRHADVEMTQDSTLLGTPLYMSPEQVENAPLDHRSDMYSLGATFFHLVSGQPPVRGRSTFEILAKKVTTEKLCLRELIAEGPAEEVISQLIERMTARDPAARYPSFEDVIVAASKALPRGKKAPELAQVVKPASRPRRTGRRFARVLVAAAAAVLVALLARGVLLDHNKALAVAPRAASAPAVEAETVAVAVAPRAPPAVTVTEAAPSPQAPQPEAVAAEPSAAERAAVRKNDLRERMMPLLRGAVARAKSEESMRRLRTGKIAEAGAVLRELEAARAGIVSAFPEAHDVADERELSAILERMRQAIDRRSRAEAEIARLGEEARAARVLLEDAETGAGAPGEPGEDIDARLDRLRGSLDRVLADKGDEGGAEGAAELHVEYEALRASRQLMRRSRAVREEVEALLGARRLSAARRALESAGDLGPKLSARVQSALAAMEALEAGLRRLVVDADRFEARRSFERVREHGAASPAAAGWAEKCLAKLATLDAAVGGMSAVRGGQVRVAADQAPRAVDGFFIDRWEVTVREYVAFASEQEAAASFALVKDLWPSAACFERYRGRPRYIDEDATINPCWPVEEVNYHQALAFLRSRGKDLPALEEWWLAAKGPYQSDGHRFRCPILPADLRRSAANPADARRGGAARAFEPESSVHHLSGNVAEWVKTAQETSRTAQLVGGRYLDDDERYFTGERRDSLDLVESGRGYGCRGVLRPAELFSALLPQP